MEEAYLTQKNDNPDPKKLERLWIEPRNMFTTLKGKKNSNKKLNKDQTKTKPIKKKKNLQEV